jgi:type VI protein secretion system component Hcp
VEFNAELAVTFGGSGGGATVGKPTLKHIGVTKYVDQITPALFENLVKGSAITGDTIADVTFEFVRPLPNGDDITRVYTFFKIELKNVYVTKLTSTGNDGDGTLEEQLEFAYSAIRQTFVPLTSAGIPDPNKSIVKSWNIVTNTDKF